MPPVVLHRPACPTSSSGLPDQPTLVYLLIGVVTMVAGVQAEEEAVEGSSRRRSTSVRGAAGAGCDRPAGSRQGDLDLVLRGSG